MTKLMLTVVNASGAQGHGECELTVDAPTEDLDNIAQAIAMGIGAAWEQMLTQAPTIPEAFPIPDAGPTAKRAQ